MPINKAMILLTLFYGQSDVCRQIETAIRCIHENA